MVTVEELEGLILLSACREAFGDLKLYAKWPVVNGTEIVGVDELPESELEKCLTLLDANLGDLYTRVNGRKWKKDKKEEMKEPGLVYILLKHDSKVIGFVSLKIVNEFEDMCLVYLYEIQFSECLRNQALGSYLMGRIDSVVKQINTDGKLAKTWYKYYKDEYTDKKDPLLHLSGIGLTVFSSNEGALKLYKRLGFVFHESSPQDKALRSGKVVKPDYYMLEKRV